MSTLVEVPTIPKRGFLTVRQMSDLLNNPVWQALETRLSRMAISHGGASRYPSCVSTFAAVSEPDDTMIFQILLLAESQRRTMAYTLLECTHD